jgi:hypothetical protein
LFRLSKRTERVKAVTRNVARRMFPPSIRNRLREIKETPGRA